MCIESISSRTKNDILLKGKINVKLPKEHYKSVIMYKTKLTSQSAASSARPVSISSNSKLQKVHKLNQIVRELDFGKKETVGSEGGVEHGVGEKVLQTLKQRIKTSYDQLYKNYAENKNKIVKQIQTVEGNISGENVMKIKQQEVIKEKSQYDKIKASIEEKQRKLKKLIDLKLQLSQTTVKETTHAIEQQQQLEKYLKKKEESEHANSIVCEMLKQRRQVLLALQKRHSELIASIKKKKDKCQNWKQGNIKRRQMINRLQQSLKEEQPLQIPTRLAEQLSSKLQQYENKYSYSNIIHHEAIIEQDRMQRQKQAVSAKREELRTNKARKEQEQRKELQKLYSIHSLNSMEQYKIMRLWGAQSIEEVLNSDPEQERMRLQELQSQIEREIKELQDKSESLQVQIQDIISEDKQKQQGESLDILQQQLAQQKRTLKRMNNDLNKQKALAIHWQTIMNFINGNKLDANSLAEIVTASASQERALLQKNISTGEFRPPYGYHNEGQSIDFQ